MNRRMTRWLALALCAVLALSLVVPALAAVPVEEAGEERVEVAPADDCGHDEAHSHGTVAERPAVSGEEETPAALAATESYIHNFTADGKSSAFYTINGNLSTSKGQVTYNGLTLTQCLKMESSTSITFTAASSGTLTLVFVEATGTAKIDDTKHTAVDGVLTCDLTAGTHTITKAETANLFYMVFASAGVPEHDHTWGEYAVTTPATCTQTGVKTAQCTYEGCSETHTETIPLAEHTYLDGKTICSVCGYDKNTQDYHTSHTMTTVTVEPTCGVDGSKTETCSVCGKVVTTVLPATGQHVWGDDGVCTVCHAQKPTGSFTKVGGGLETAYAQWGLLANVTSYKVYVKAADAADSAYEEIDDELIRQYPTYMRADVVGLAAGSYVLKVEGLAGGTVQTTMTTGTITVLPHDRSGFAFVNGTSSGAYNEDGTLKSNAVVLYITPETKDNLSLTVTTSSKGTTTDCTSLQDIINAFKKGCDSRPLCVRLIGNITDFAVMDKGDIVVDGCSNGITVEGIGIDAVANGWGLRIKGSSNVEVRNLGFMNCDSGEGDCLGLQQDNDHVWAHNNDFFYGDAGSDADQAKGDGSLDTKTSTYVTHSYNHFWDSGKCNLQGMKSESTENYITYHHNWYDHSDSRHPRIRTCTVHIYNNYFDGNAKYGVGMTMGGSAFVENNYFRNVSKPMMISGQGTDAAGEGTFSGEAGGVIKAYNNKMVMEGRALTYLTQKDSATSFDAYEVSARDEQVPSSVKALSGGTTYNNFDTNASLMYSCTPDTPDEAMVKVQNYAGRLEGGDFQWTFNNATDDADYGVNAAMKSALTNYKSTLVSVGGTVAGDIPTSSEDPTPCAHTNQRTTVTKAATCVDTGTRLTVCQDCGVTLATETIPVSADNHSFGADGVCIYCQAKQASSGSGSGSGGSSGGGSGSTTPTTSVYTLTVDDMTETLATKGKVVTGQGTNGFFTIYSSTGGVGTDYSASTKNFSDGTTLSKALKTGGALSVSESEIACAIGFETAGAATVKVWWRGGTSNETRHLVIKNSTGTDVATSTDALNSDSIAITTMSLTTAGTYYLGGQGGGNSVYQVEVTVTASSTVTPEPEPVVPDVASSGWMRGTQRDLKWYYTEAEVLTVEQMESGDTVWVASYDGGALTGIQKLTPTSNTLEIPSATPSVKLFWLDDQLKPLSAAATVIDETV